MERKEILSWLKEKNPDRLETLWRLADETRQKYVGDEVHLRGLLEISNYCVRACHYCGLRVENVRLERYRMTGEEILGCSHQAAGLGYGTVVLQSGEDYGLAAGWVAGLVSRIKAETPLAVTLSLGERAPEELALWRRSGADRYLLRFETSNRKLFNRIHPAQTAGRGVSDRLALLEVIRNLDYETGSGIMIGLPGQSFEDLAKDLETFRCLDLDMIGVGPWIPHPDTPLASQALSLELPGDEQVPNSEQMTYKVIALSRILCSKANIPSTTALATLNRSRGRELGLQRGANVVMPNLTPPRYRRLYEIYPAKACIQETAQDCCDCLRLKIRSLGRESGQGRGDSPAWLTRKAVSGCQTLESNDE